jgi:predicted nucleic acid-binding protein
VSEVVLDASVVLKWFRSEGERHVDEARALRTAYEKGELLVFAPPLHLEILNVAGRRWRLGEEALVELAGALEELGFELLEPPLERVAHWITKWAHRVRRRLRGCRRERRSQARQRRRLILELARDVAEPLATT